MSNIDKQAQGEKTREAFERWAEQSGALPWGILKKHRNQDGTYPGPHYTYMWHAWNACHEALLDELEAKDAELQEYRKAETKPVGYFGRFDADDEDLIDQCSQNIKGAFPLYAAPPAPVSVPDAMEMDDDFDSAFEHGKAVGWNAYRAAMLQSFGNSEQLNSPVIPDGWVACSERMPEIGIKVLCFPVNDEPIHATYNGQVWLQDISWSTSDEPIDNVISCNVFHWMPLPAAPQQEA